MTVNAYDQRVRYAYGLRPVDIEYNRLTFI